MGDFTWSMRAKVTSDSEADALYIKLVDEIGKGEAVANEVFALGSRASEVVFDFDDVDVADPRNPKTLARIEMPSAAPHLDAVRSTRGTIDELRSRTGKDG
jgi:hypothetical protein